jgi:hypothetical protein
MNVFTARAVAKLQVGRIDAGIIYFNEPNHSLIEWLRFFWPSVGDQGINDMVNVFFILPTAQAGCLLLLLQL